MTKHIISIALSAAVLLTSCDKAESSKRRPQKEIGQTVQMTFQANTEAGPSTKISLDGVHPVWDKDDQISLFGKNGTNAAFKADKINGQSAQFTGDGDAEGPYLAVYPYSTDNAVSQGVITTRIQAVQQLSSENIAPGAALAVASCLDNQTLNFKNVASLVKVKIVSEGISSFTVSTLDSLPLAGKLTVDAATAQITSTSETSASVTLLPAGESFLPGTYYIAILPVKSTGITITMTRLTDKRKAERSYEKEFSAARNVIKNIGEVISNQFDWGYLIDCYQDFKDYASDKDNWNEDGETVTLRADIDMNMESWKPITDSYTGSFEGNGHCIYNINLRSADYAHLGVFGQYAKDIRNLTFGSKDGKSYDGKSEIYNSFSDGNTRFTYSAPVTLPSGTLENITNFMPVTVSKNCGNKCRTAGIAAWAEKDGAQIINCTNHAAITVGAATGEDANVNMGGILSGINAAHILVKGCINRGKIRSSCIYTKAMGGIVGQSYTAALEPVIEDCENYGEVILQYTNTQNDFFCLGGIIGRANSKAENPPLTVRNCKNYGAVTGQAVHQQGVGGIVGRAEGAQISGCTNEGAVTIDHTKAATARWQAAGGILGIAMDGYGRNSVDNCINRGNVTMTKVASCGRASTSSTSLFYGVTCGGIVGCAAYIASITGNRNYGSLDATNEYSAKDATTMRATVYAGGILGYDYGNVPIFGNNWCDKSVQIKAATTFATSKYGEIRAGGVVGSLENSTLSSGSGSARIITSNASASAKAYAGSVAGYNAATISYCTYGGTINGAVADASNTVGNGNQPISSAPAGDESSDQHDGQLPDMGGETGNWD